MSQKSDLINALVIMVKWATTGDKNGNPYCKNEIKYALSIMEKNGCCPVEWQNICAKDKTTEIYLKAIETNKKRV